MANPQRHSATVMQKSVIIWVWDELKAASNLRKHKVSFELASIALDDPWQISQLDTGSYEYRFKTLAQVEGVILLVVHSEPDAERYSGNLIGRIISARLATPAERRAYQNA